MALHSIYALCEPGTGDVRYVGRTSRGIKTRHYEHVHLAMRLIKRNSKTRFAPVYRWLISLVEARRYPEVILLAECSEDKAIIAEQAWIDVFLDNGYELFNVAPPRRSTRYPLCLGAHHSSTRGPVPVYTHSIDFVDRTKHEQAKQS